MKALGATTIMALIVAVQGRLKTLAWTAVWKGLRKPPERRSEPVPLRVSMHTCNGLQCLLLVPFVITGRWNRGKQISALSNYVLKPGASIY